MSLTTTTHLWTFLTPIVGSLRDVSVHCTTVQFTPRTNLTTFCSILAPKFIIISYFDKGVISFDELSEILNTRTRHWEKIPIFHNTFNRLRGLAKSKNVTETKDFLFLLHL